MDFSFNEVQEDLRGLARQILGDQVTLERLKELEAGKDRIDRRVWAEFAKAELLGVALPTEEGGSGYGIMELCIILTEVGRHVALLPLLPTVVAAMAIAQFGDTTQRNRYLPGVVDGSLILSLALQEQTCSAPDEPAVTARREEAGWVLDGEKVAVPWAPLADALLVPASTPDGGVVMFVIDPHGPGVAVERGESTHRHPQGLLRLEGAIVGPDAQLGDAAAGRAITEWVYERAVAGLCATAVGVFDRALRITADYISEREQFEKPIAAFQGATLRAADAYIDTQAASVATWSAVWRLSEDRPATDELAIAKFWVADGGQRIVHACQHLHGGMGVDIDYPIHRYFLWAKELELSLGGATDQLLRLGRALAGAKG